MSTAGLCGAKGRSSRPGSTSPPNSRTGDASVDEIAARLGQRSDGTGTGIRLVDPRCTANWHPARVLDFTIGLATPLLYLAALDEAQAHPSRAYRILGQSC